MWNLMENSYAKQRIIQDISNDDLEIQVMGNIKSIEGNDLHLSDKTGELRVDIEQVDCSKFTKDDIVNVIGKIEIKTTGEKVLTASIIQDKSKINFNYYQKLYELKKELE